MGAVDCRRFVLTLMCVQPDLNRCRMCKVLWAVEGRPSATKAFKVALQSTRASWLGSGEELGNLCVGCQGCVERSGGLELPNLPLSILSGVQLAPTSPKLVEGEFCELFRLDGLLRGSLHAARTALASDPVVASRYLASKEERIPLCPDIELWVDVETFEEAAGAARRSREPAAYRAAIELYVGDLLPEDRYEEWAEGRRGELVRTYLTLLVELAGTYEERAEYDSAIEVLRKVVAEEPTSEEAHAGLMRLYALSGSKGEALAQYVQLEETLAKKLGAEPAASSRSLREEIAAGRFPPQKTPPLGSPSKK